MSIWLAVLICSLVIALLCAPLVPLARGRLSAKSARRRVIMNLCTFAFVCLCGVVLPMTGFAAEPAAAASGSAVLSIAGTTAQGLGFLAAALSTGLSALGAGIAVAAAAPAAIGAVSENAKSFGKAIIFVVLGEGIAIYGLLISILIINRL